MSVKMLCMLCNGVNYLSIECVKPVICLMCYWKINVNILKWKERNRICLICVCIPMCMGLGKGMIMHT